MNNYISLLHGGNNTFFGGFPPLYKSNDVNINVSDKKKRELTFSNSIISVHNILDSRRKMPFINIDNLSGGNNTYYESINDSRKIDKN